MPGTPRMRFIALVLSVALFHLCYADDFNCNNNAIGNDVRELFLNFHNEARRRIAKGLETGAGGKKLNKASNMNKLRWNCDLEKLAQDHSKYCNAPEGPVGNYYALVSNFNGAAADREIVPFALKMTWTAVTRTPINQFNDYEDCALQSFSQMANARTTEIGCTVSKCGSKRQIVCVYNWIGPIKKRPMWHTGEACSECPTTCDDGLCVRPVEKADDGKSTICSTEFMTDKMRTKILDAHNEYRSLVAKGSVQNLTNGNLPPATSMYKLKYDCNLEMMAARHAMTCSHAHSTPEHRKNNGENIFNAYIGATDKSNIALMATDGWFYEAKRYGIFADNRLTNELLNRPNMEVGHYTQVVWAATQSIGCAVERCKNGYFVVCNYSPAGNTLDQVIYQTGEPCSKCPSGSKCSQNEKLCVVDDFSWIKDLNF